MNAISSRMPALKAFFLITGFGLVTLTCVGYYAARQFLRPYDVPEFQEIDTSESAFLIPLDSGFQDSQVWATPSGVHPDGC